MSTPKQDPVVADKPAASGAEAGAPRLPVVVDPPAAAPPVPPPPRARFWWRVAGIAFAVLAVVAFYLQPWASGPPAVAVEIVEPAPVTRVLAVNGRIAALYSVDVRAQVSGPLTAVLADEGDLVQADAELARVDAAAQQAVVRQAAAGLDAALVAQEQAEAALARADALGANVARTELDRAAAAAQTAAQEVTRMGALLDQAQIRLANFTIRAPMSGTVLAVNASVGQNIDASSVLFTIADLGQLIVETDVDEAYATQISAGLPAVLQLAGEARKREGRVSFVSQQVEAATGGLTVKLAFDEPVTAPVGLTVTANIVVEQLAAAITAPRAAIQFGAEGAAVFVVVDGTAMRRAVEVTEWPAERLVVTEGLAQGDILIADTSDIIEGQAVRVVLP
ncbi:efflux RND transporter periplasmic adaptor subunit [Phaeovulum sp.]|uniref:efflux RND transporter periplasmic adaptor subunit n=1 Tax=Phaeovulum sp. TaxID=2934796 RepID=UPI0035681FD3